MSNLIHTTHWITAFALLLVVGCASSPESVRDSAAGKVEFQIEKPLAEVYEQIATKATHCNPGVVRDWPDSPLNVLPGLETQWIIRTEISNDGTSARIQFLNKRHGVESHYMVTDFTDIGNRRTKVSTSYRFSPWERAADNVKGWVTGGSQSCWLRG